MPQMKVQPIDSSAMRESVQVADPAKVVLKSRLRRLFDRQFRVSSTERPIIAVDEAQVAKECGAGVDFEPSSVCLTKMVRNFIEENNDRPSEAANAAKCGRNRCNCFNGKSTDSSDEDLEDFWSESAGSSTSGELYELVKSLVPCASMAERNLLADTSKIVENHSRNCNRKDELREIVTNNLCVLGYDASICKSAWDKTSSYPAGEYEYIDVVMIGGSERLLIDVDFRSEFEMARSTGAYRTILQLLPFIFVGNADRLQQIIVAISEAAKQSLKKKGMHIPPWRKAEYMKSKWFSAYTRSAPSPPHPSDAVSGDEMQQNSPEKIQAKCTVDQVGEAAFEKSLEECTVEEVEEETETGELELIFGDQFSPAEASSVDTLPPAAREREGVIPCAAPPVVVQTPWQPPVVVQTPWQPPAVRPRVSERGVKVITGLASLLKENL